MITRITIEIDELFAPMIDPYVEALQSEFDSGMDIKRDKKKDAIVIEFEDPLEPNEVLCDRIADVFAQTDEQLASE